MKFPIFKVIFLFLGKIFLIFGGDKPLLDSFLNTYYCNMRNTLKIQRAIFDLTQAELAAKVSVSTWTINALEANKYSPSVGLAMRIARLFGKPVEEIFIYEDGD